MVAHSQGTVITLAALQEGLRVDNAVFMGSPLSQKLIQTAGDQCRLATAAGNVGCRLVNLHSRDDRIVNLLKPAVNLLTPDGCIGGRGLPGQISGLASAGNIDRCRHWTLDGQPIVICVEMPGIEHYGDKGWWSTNWLKTDECPPWSSQFTRDDFVDLLSSTVPVDRDLSAIRSFASSNEFLTTTKEGFGASDARNQANWQFTLSGGTETGFHFDDKRSINYELEVLSGELDFQVKHATFFEWEPKLESQVTSISVDNSVVRGNYRSPNRFMDATLYLQLKAKSPIVVVR